MIAAMAQTLPRNADVAEQLELLSDILELEGEAAYRLLAYRRAAALVREQSGLVAELALEGKAKELPGIGKTIEGKIVEIVNEGEIRALTKHKALVPPGVVQFTRWPGCGPKTARKIWQELGVTTLADLKAAAKAERLRVLPGIGAKLEERIVKELSGKRKAPEEVRPLLGVGLPAVQAVVTVLRAHPASLEVSDAGSVRRRKETFRDLDIIATASEPAALTEYFTKLRWVEKVAARGESKATVVSNDGLRFDLRVVPSGLYGNLLQHFTGSKHHNVALREDAVRRGLSISENGVKDVESGEIFKTGSEEGLYEFLGYRYIPPELRENLGELEAARNGELPELVKLDDLRGDLHAHSTWSSDGTNSIEEMAAEAKSRGYSYLAITDHSHYLRDGRLEAQDREIEALNEMLGRFRLLKGIEVNIRADGSLDVDDETRAGRGRGRSAALDLERRPLDSGARLSGARRRPGSAGVADEGAGTEHSDVAADQEAARLNFRDDGAAALEWAASYLERVRELPVLAQVEPGEIRRALPESPPEVAEPFSAVLRDLDEGLLPGITHWQHPRFFAYFATTGSEPGILAELLAATLNAVAFIWRTSPASTELEAVTLDWLAQLLGLPSGWHGHIEDTASTSTIAARAAARETTGGRVVVCSEQAHSSVDKAARLLGLELRKTPVDEAFHLRRDALDTDDAAAVVATVGTTSTAAVDPVPAIADACEAAGVWLHVDAAYAGSAWG